MGVGGQGHALAALPPGKTWYPLYGRLGGPQGRCGKYRLQRDSIPGPSSMYQVAIPTTLSRPASWYAWMYMEVHYSK
jgi:hypothetical protein